MKHILKIACMVTLTLMTVSVKAADQPATPKQVIISLFDAMRAGDKEKLLSLWAEGASLRRITAKGQLRPDGLQRWANWVGTLKAGQADEQIFNVRVEQFGNLATVWAPFKISLDGKLVGCGVNQFTLAKQQDQGWKIVSGIDTNATGDCQAYGKK